MTIKQQGGIFGRNPEFNDLDVTGTATLDNLIVSGNTISTASGTNGNIVLDPDGTGVVQIQEDLVVNHFRSVFGSTNAQIQLKVSDDSKKAAIEFYDEVDGLGHADMRYTYDEVTPANENLRFRIGMRGSDSNFYMKENGDFDIEGNLVVASGQGIDFSATSGTGTSELFDDYEEGVFTPTLTTDATDFSSVTYDADVFGSYTKVGNVVHIQLFMQTDAVTKGSASGNVIIGGLPFTADGTSPLAVATSKDWLANHPTRAYVADGATTISLLTNANNTADDENVVVADVKTLGNDNTLRLSGTYRAS